MQSPVECYNSRSHIRQHSRYLHAFVGLRRAAYALPRPAFWFKGVGEKKAEGLRKHLDEQSASVEEPDCNASTFRSKMDQVHQSHRNQFKTRRIVEKHRETLFQHRSKTRSKSGATLTQ